MQALNEPISPPRSFKEKGEPPSCNAGFVRLQPTDSGSGATVAAQKLLAKLPEQVLQFYSHRNITPNDLMTVEETWDCCG